MIVFRSHKSYHLEAQVRFSVPFSAFGCCLNAVLMQDSQGPSPHTNHVCACRALAASAYGELVEEVVPSRHSGYVAIALSLALALRR